MVKLIHVIILEALDSMQGIPEGTDLTAVATGGS